MPVRDDRLDLAALRTRLSASTGREYWRSLQELAETEGFQEFLAREFPRQASQWNDPVGRRKFLKLMGASLALAGLGACARQPDEQIVPYVRQPEDLVLGKPLFFATAMTLEGMATGLLVESREGRPIKVEGNPNHPASLGAADVFAQASVLSLYDPDRAQAVTLLGQISSWPAFLEAVRAPLEAQRRVKGAGLRLLTGTVTSPVQAAQLQELLSEMPEARRHQYEPARGGGAYRGALLAFGRPLNTLYRFDRAEVILSLDADFLTAGPACLRYARDFSRRRRVGAGQSEMNRLYVVESAPTGTGAKADHRWPLCPSQVEAFAWELGEALGVTPAPETERAPGGLSGRWMNAVVRDLLQHRGSSIVIAGDYQPPVVHALAHAINHALGNVGSTVVYTEPVEADPVDHTESLRRLAVDMDSGDVDILVILGVNPVYSAPADLDWTRRMSKVRLRIYLSPYYDETSELCHWHIPQAHYLESWSDARAYDGTVSILQPLIAPLYHGKSAHELLAALSGQPERSGYEIVREYWQTRMGAARRSGGLGEPAAGADFGPAGDFERAWRRALHDGIVAGTALPPVSVSMKQDWAARLPQTAVRSPAPVAELEILFRPDPCIHDGQFANNGWLQELPKPLTRLTWDNAALISPATAERLGISQSVAWRGGEQGRIWTDRVQLQFRGRRVTAPVWIVPGHSDDCVTVHLGYGRRRGGRVGAGAGFNAYALRTSDALGSGSGLEIFRTAVRYPLACTQYHHSIEGRDLVRSATLQEYQDNPGFARAEFQDPLKTPSLYPGFEYKDYAWGMTIDLNACVGCNACVVACQAENNIPVVGKQEVMNGRAMHWLRIDRYYRGGLENPETYFQPVLCHHCENAPCEVVCPVQATTHSAEGLNTMVYNRCVGTRYCSNNCPYKVRRFNFLQYADWETPSLKLLRNPDVSVRSRGVMEKCTYCVQRINRARIEAERENRKVRDGDIVTACQAACPAEAIVFGDINDRESRVARLKSEPRNYGMLEELNTRPRTTYLAAVRNPNPDLERA